MKKDARRNRQTAGEESSMLAKASTPERRGRPETRVLKLHITPEEAFRRIFAAAKPPDLSLRKPRK